VPKGPCASQDGQSSVWWSARGLAISGESRSAPFSMRVCVDSGPRCSLKVSEVQGDIAAALTPAGSRADVCCVLQDAVRGYGHGNDDSCVRYTRNDARPLPNVQTCFRQRHKHCFLSSDNLFRASLQQCFRAGAEPLRSRIRAFAFAGIDQYSRSSNRGCSACSPIPRCAKYQIDLAVRPADLHSPHLVVSRLPETPGLGCRVPLLI